MQGKLKKNKQTIDEYEDEITQLKTKNRKITRDMDELTEQFDRDIASLKQKQR